MAEFNKVRAFGLITGGIIVGEVLVETKKVVKMKHPAWFIAQGRKQSMQQVVPVLFQDWENISANFTLPRSSVLYSADAPLQMVGLYEKIRNQIVEAARGIKIATTEDLEKIARVSPLNQANGSRIL